MCLCGWANMGLQSVAVSSLSSLTPACYLASTPGVAVNPCPSACGLEGGGPGVKGSSPFPTAITTRHSNKQKRNVAPAIGKASGSLLPRPPTSPLGPY